MRLDYFALLHQPRRPWLDPEKLKASFLSLSAEVHPNRVHNESPEQKQEATRRFAELNAAHNCLRETKDRLLHLIELETGARPGDIQAAPSTAMELFMQVGQLCRDVDLFLARRAQVTSPILQVEQFERAQTWMEQLRSLQQSIDAARDQWTAELRALDAKWDAALAVGSGNRSANLPLARLEDVYRAFSYLNRWTAQIQERLVQLSF